MNDLSQRVIEAAGEGGLAFERIGRGFRVDRLRAVLSRPPAPALAGRRPR